MLPTQDIIWACLALSWSTKNFNKDCRISNKKILKHVVHPQIVQHSKQYMFFGIFQGCKQTKHARQISEVESLRTSLASRTSSRTRFEVGLGLEGQVLGLEASNPQKLPCPGLEDSTIFRIVKILWSAWKNFWKTFFSQNRLKNFGKVLFFWDRLKNFCEDLFFWRALVLVSVVPGLGLEHSCPWPRVGLSSERLSLALAASLVSSTPSLANMLSAPVSLWHFPLLMP